MAATTPADDFRALVVEFGAAHAKQAELSAALKEVRTKARAMQESILGYMQEHDIDECEWAGGRLVRKRTKRTEGLKKEHIQGELRKLCADDAAAIESAVAAMYNRRLTELHETLAVVKGGGGEEDA